MILPQRPISAVNFLATIGNGRRAVPEVAFLEEPRRDKAGLFTANCSGFPFGNGPHRMIGGNGQDRAADHAELAPANAPPWPGSLSSRGTKSRSDRTSARSAGISTREQAWKLDAASEPPIGTLSRFKSQRSKREPQFSSLNSLDELQSIARITFL